MNRWTPFVKNMMIINFILYLLNYVVEIALPEYNIRLNYQLGLYYFMDPAFRPYQLFTNFFMHADTFHLAFNMISLYYVGTLLENYWGAKRLLNFYLICGIGAGIFYILVQGLFIYKSIGSFFPSPEQWEMIPQYWGVPAVGASGALYGVFTAVALLFPNSEFYLYFIPIPIKAKYLLIAAVVISIVLGGMNMNGDNVAHFGHLGGILTGYILTKYINKDRRHFY